MLIQKNSLFWKLFLPLIVVFCATLVGLSLWLPGIAEKNARDAAILSAERTVQQFKTLRGYYTKNILSKVKAGSDLKPTVNPGDNPKEFPLPATMIHELSAQLSAQGINIGLYSNFPFPNRADRKLDEFQQKAWDTLSADTSVARVDSVETINGESFVRVAMSDTMSAPGCVSCHNNHPDTPRTGWKLGDVRGVLEVKLPITQALAANWQMSMLILSVVAVVLLLSILLAAWIYRHRIQSRFAAFTYTIQALVDGDLTERLNESGKDELSTMASLTNKFIMELQRLVTDVISSSSEVYEAVDSMSSVANKNHTLTEQQQKQMELMSSGMLDMETSINESTGYSKQVMEKISDINEQGQACVRESDLMYKGIEELQSVSSNVQTSVEGLSENSKEIGDVLDVIQGIAEQTNLLALNAAIEAARAGEQGRGFAVVADEVRTLAGRTQQSTEEIRKTIEKLQKGTSDVVAAVDTSNQCVDTSLNKVKESNQILNEITAQLDEIYQMNDQIVNAANSQNELVSGSEKRISETLDSSHKISDQSADVIAKCSNVQKLSESLSRKVSHFKGLVNSW